MGNLKQGDWLQLGRYGRRGTKPDELLWRCAAAGKGTFSMISAHVLIQLPFDDAKRGYQNGDNRWSECTLRLQLNHDEGFLRAFTPGERAALVPVSLKTEVVSSYQAERRSSVDTTLDRVWLPTWEEYRKLPKELQHKTPTKSILRDSPDAASYGHWSRSPLDGLGCVVLELFFKTRAECNSGASETWGVRPWIAIDRSTKLDGKGTERDPFRLGLVALPIT